MNQPFMNLREFGQLSNRSCVGGLGMTFDLASGRMIAFFQFSGKVAVAMKILKRLVMSGRESGKVSFNIGRERPSCPEALEEEC